jgi:hypothetical protein
VKSGGKMAFGSMAETDPLDLFREVDFLAMPDGPMTTAHIFGKSLSPASRK